VSRPLVIAHRGASAYRPQNTMPAFELAIAQRADIRHSHFCRYYQFDSFQSEPAD
jgi:hypothetical protein